MIDILKQIFKNTVVKILISLFIGIILGFSMNGPTKEQMESVELVSLLEDEVAILKGENVTLQNKIDEAQPWFEMEEAKRKATEEKLEKERKEKEKREKEKKEAKERKGYETGITYDNLARTPDKYIDKKVKFTGKVVQVIEDSAYTQMRLAINDDYDKIILIEVLNGTTETRILEDDTITIMGKSAGLITYESTMGGKITIPSVNVDKIIQ